MKPVDVECPNKSQKTGKKGSLASNSSSYSFLELPWTQNEAHALENAKYLDRYRNSIENKISADSRTSRDVPCSAAHTEAPAKTSPEKLSSHTDPLFYRYDFLIPSRLKRFVERPPFRFSFVAQPCLEIQEAGVTKAMVDVLDFREIDSNMHVATEIAFVINRRRVRQLFVAEENKNYKNAINSRTSYERGSNRFREMSDTLIAYQIKHKINLLDISTKDDLVREIKCIVKSFNEKRSYVPKVKTFDSGQDAFACYVLAMIPGISKNVAGAISKRFGDIATFFRFLENSTLEELRKVEVHNNDKTKKRLLGERQSCLVKKFLLEDIHLIE